MKTLPTTTFEAAALTGRPRYVVSVDPFMATVTYAESWPEYIGWFTWQWVDLHWCLTMMAWAAHVCSLFGHQDRLFPICSRCGRVREDFQQTLQQQLFEQILDTPVLRMLRAHPEPQAPFRVPINPKHWRTVYGVSGPAVDSKTIH